MLVRDAIERWGREHRDEVADRDSRLLRRMWSGVRSTELGSRDVADLSPEERTAILAPFDAEEIVGAASLLASVLSWARGSQVVVEPPLDPDGTADESGPESTGSSGPPKTSPRSVHAAYLAAKSEESDEPGARSAAAPTHWKLGGPPSGLDPIDTPSTVQQQVRRLRDADAQGDSAGHGSRYDHTRLSARRLAARRPSARRRTSSSDESSSPDDGELPTAPSSPRFDPSFDTAVGSGAGASGVQLDAVSSRTTTTTTGDRRSIGDPRPPKPTWRPWRPGLRQGTGGAEARQPPLDGYLVPVIALAGAVLAGLASAAPTGTAGWDFVLKAVVAALFVLAVARASDEVSIIVSTIALAFVGRSPWLPVACVGLLAAFGASLVESDRSRVSPRLLRAIAGAAAIQALFRLPPMVAFGAPSIIAGIAIAIGMGAGYRRLGDTARSWVRRGVILVMVLSLMVVAAGGVAMLSARADLEQGISAARTGLSAARGGDPENVVESLEAAADALEAADAKVTGIWTQPLRLVPVAAQHQAAVALATEQGSAIARQASRATIDADISSISMTAGSVDLAALSDMEPDLVATVELLAEGVGELTRAQSPWLLPPVASRMQSLADEMRAVLPEARVAADAAAVVPQMLGSEGPRRYVVLFGSPAESREFGGFVGSWALIEFDNGAMHQIDAGRISDLYDLSRSNAPLGPLGYPEWYVYRAVPEYWPQNLTSSPQMATVTSATRALLDGLGGAPVDGMIYVDGYALAAMLDITGAIPVDGLDYRLSADNAVDFFFDGQYRIDDRDEVKDDLTELFATAFARLTDIRLPGPERLGRVLGPVARQGRLQVMTFDDDENAFLRSVHLQRTFGRSSEAVDTLAVVQANGSASKLDLYLQRSIDYEVSVDDTGALTGSATVVLTSEVPPDAPEYALGANDPGQNRSYLSLYTPHDVTAVAIDGEVVEHDATEEFGLHRYEVLVELPPNQEHTVEFRFTGRVDPRRPYGLAVWHQPLVNADDVRVIHQSAAGSQSTSLQLVEDVLVNFAE